MYKRQVLRPDIFYKRKPPAPKPPAGQAVFFHKSGPPAKPGACASPRRAYCRQASQEALNTLPPASPTPPSVNGVLPAACCIFLVLNTIPLRSELTAKAFLLSTAQPGGVSLKPSHNHRAGGLSWPYKGLLPAYISRRTEIYFARITCPTACKRAISVLTAAFCS